MNGYAGPDDQMVVELYIRNIKESREFYKSEGLRFTPRISDLER